MQNWLILPKKLFRLLLLGVRCRGGHKHVTDSDCTSRPGTPDLERDRSEAIIKENKMGVSPKVPRQELWKVPDLGDRTQKR